jgi:aryl-alcohol dehydrogenase-like predicted oxidoreductase
MDYRPLGRAGIKVSPLCLGNMNFGGGADEGVSRSIMDHALDKGINFFDTANTYSDGTSEEIVGRALRDFAKRDEIVVATKGFFPWRKGPNGSGLSRKAIMTAIDGSLTRLGMDYVDLYQIHRWDNQTPIEETLEALHDLVKAGKVRYIGASSMYAWQFAKALYLADRHGWTRFATMQNHYNLIVREEEREMLPLCAAEGVGVIPWSPLARGRLARDWDENTSRAETDQVSKRLYTKTADADRRVAESVAAIAAQRGVPRAQIALAWVLRNPAVTAPIVGASKPHHLEDAMAALSLQLTSEEITALEENYIPHLVQW